MARFVPSEYQIDIFNNFRKTKKNIVVQAVPGSGKTTTIIELIKYVPPGKQSIFLAFNNSTVVHLKKKVYTTHTPVLTLHSLGCKAIYKYYGGNVEKNDFKIFRIAKNLATQNKWDVPKDKLNAYLFNIQKIVTLFRLNNESDFGAIEDIINYHDIDTIGGEIEHSIQTIDAMYAYNKSMSKSSSRKFEIDFCDMIWLPVFNSRIKMQTYDIVFVDEIQDLNAVQQALIDKIMHANSRFVAVGDPRQSIYGFLASDLKSYENFKSRTNTIELPLSYCYRCGTEIVKMVNQVYNVVKSPDDMHSGEVIDDGNFDDIQEGDFVLCRNNAPLAELYFDFIEKEMPCYIKGSEIGKSIINTVKEYSGNTKKQTIKNIEGKLAEIYSELKAKGIKKPKKHPKYYNLYEKLLVFGVIALKYNTMKDIIDAIERMFKDVGNGIVLSSGHKSKGLEADNVYLYRMGLIPSEYATQPWQIEQEENLRYVMMSRARKKLIFVGGVHIQNNE